MEQHSPLMAILARESEVEFAHQLANSMGFPVADIVLGSASDAALVLATRSTSPRYILLDIGDRQADILPELDQMAEHCVEGTRVVVIGSINDIHFYRQLRDRGVVEYFPRPARVADVRTVFTTTAGGQERNGKIISLMSAASGDGASTVALNLAYALASNHEKSVVLVDMDYQFGMIAKNLDMTTPYGIREVMEHPERGIDAPLMERMVVSYKDKLKIVAAPHELRQLPNVPPEIVRDMLHVLRQKFDVVVVDVPHIWTPWTASAISAADTNLLVAQLWLRSVTHASRLLRAWGELGLDASQIQLIINRSGAKFKEAVGVKDFERVCGLPVQHFLANDIRAVITAENQGCTVLELASTPLQRQLRELAAACIGSTSVKPASADHEDSARKGIFRFGKS
jgi:pilus assembly protein CpaE